MNMSVCTQSVKHPNLSEAGKVTQSAEPPSQPASEQPEASSAPPTDSTAAAAAAQSPKEKVEGAIVFETVDFERLQEVPKY